MRNRSKSLLREKNNLSVLCDERFRLLKAKDEEVENLKARLSLANAEAAEAFNLCNQVSALKSLEDSLIERNFAL